MLFGVIVVDDVTSSDSCTGMAAKTQQHSAAWHGAGSRQHINGGMAGMALAWR